MDTITILTGVLTMATVVLAYYTYLMQSEAKKNRLETSHGFITVTAEQDDHQRIYIVIKNIGLGPAFDIKLVSGNDFIYVNDYHFNAAEFTNLPLLKPNQEIRTIFGNSYAMVSGINENITCSWRNKDNTYSSIICNLRVKMFDHILKVGTNNAIDKLKDELIKLNKTVKEISNTLDK